jgi:hypothetical protein
MSATCRNCKGPIQVTNRYGICRRNPDCLALNRSAVHQAHRASNLARTKDWLRQNPHAMLYNNMIQRCYNPKATGYDRYGGRGITVHSDWLGGWAQGGKRFQAWIEENLGPRPEGCSLDRIDPDGNYEPGNLQWADDVTQRRNQQLPRLVEKLRNENEQLRRQLSQVADG